MSEKPGTPPAGGDEKAEEPERSGMSQKEVTPQRLINLEQQAVLLRRAQRRLLQVVFQNGSKIPREELRNILLQTFQSEIDTITESTMTPSLKEQLPFLMSSLSSYIGESSGIPPEITSYDQIRSILPNVLDQWYRIYDLHLDGEEEVRIFRSICKNALAHIVNYLKPIFPGEWIDRRPIAKTIEQDPGLAPMPDAQIAAFQDYEQDHLNWSVRYRQAKLRFDLANLESQAVMPLHIDREIFQWYIDLYTTESQPVLDLLGETDCNAAHETKKWYEKMAERVKSEFRNAFEKAEIPFEADQKESRGTVSKVELQQWMDEALGTVNPSGALDTRLIELREDWKRFVLDQAPDVCTEGWLTEAIEKVIIAMARAPLQQLPGSPPPSDLQALTYVTRKLAERFPEHWTDIDDIKRQMSGVLLQIFKRTTKGGGVGLSMITVPSIELTPTVANRALTNRMLETVRALTEERYSTLDESQKPQESALRAENKQELQGLEDAITATFDALLKPHMTKAEVKVILDAIFRNVKKQAVKQFQYESPADIDNFIDPLKRVFDSIDRECPKSLTQDNLRKLNRMVSLGLQMANKVSVSGLSEDHYQRILLSPLAMCSATPASQWLSHAVHEEVQEGYRTIRKRVQAPTLWKPVVDKIPDQTYGTPALDEDFNRMIGELDITHPSLPPQLEELRDRVLTLDQVCIDQLPARIDRSTAKVFFGITGRIRMTLAIELEKVDPKKGAELRKKIEENIAAMERELDLMFPETKKNAPTLRTEMSLEDLRAIQLRYLQKHPKPNYKMLPGASTDEAEQFQTAVAARGAAHNQLLASLPYPISHWKIIENHVADIWRLYREHMEPMNRFLAPQDAASARARVFSASAHLKAGVRKDFALPGTPPQKTILTRDELWVLFEEEWRFSLIDSMNRQFSGQGDGNEVPDTLQTIKARVYPLIPGQINKKNALAVLETLLGSYNPTTLNAEENFSISVLEDAWKGLKERAMEELDIGMDDDDKNKTETFALEGEGPLSREKLLAALNKKIAGRESALELEASWKSTLRKQMTRYCPETIEGFSGLSSLLHWLAGNAAGGKVYSESPHEAQGWMMDEDPTKEIYTPVFREVGRRFGISDMTITPQFLRTLTQRSLTVIPRDEIQSRLFEALGKKSFEEWVQISARREGLLDSAIHRNLTQHFSAVREALPCFLAAWLPEGISSLDELLLLDSYLRECFRTEGCFVGRGNPERAAEILRDGTYDNYWRPIHDRIHRYISSPLFSKNRAQLVENARILEGEGPIERAHIMAALPAVPDLEDSDDREATLLSEQWKALRKGVEDCLPETIHVSADIHSLVFLLAGYAAGNATMKDPEHPSSCVQPDDDIPFFCGPMLEHVARRLGIPPIQFSPPRLQAYPVRAKYQMSAGEFCTRIAGFFNHKNLRKEIDDFSKSSGGKVNAGRKSAVTARVHAAGSLSRTVMAEWFPGGITSDEEHVFLDAFFSNRIISHVLELASDASQHYPENKRREFLDAVSARWDLFQEKLKKEFDIRLLKPTIAKQALFDVYNTVFEGVIAAEDQETLVDILSSESTCLTAATTFNEKHASATEALKPPLKKEMCIQFIQNLRSAIAPFIHALIAASPDFGERVNARYETAFKKLETTMESFFPSPPSS